MQDTSSSRYFYYHPIDPPLIFRSPVNVFCVDNCKINTVYVSTKRGSRRNYCTPVYLLFSKVVRHHLNLGRDLGETIHPALKPKVNLSFSFAFDNLLSKAGEM
jgi:hypothetical protein